MHSFAYITYIFTTRSKDGTRYCWDFFWTFFKLISHLRVWDGALVDEPGRGLGCLACKWSEKSCQSYMSQVTIPGHLWWCHRGWARRWRSPWPPPGCRCPPPRCHSRSPRHPLTRQAPGTKHWTKSRNYESVTLSLLCTSWNKWYKDTIMIHDIVASLPCPRPQPQRSALSSAACGWLAAALWWSEDK